MQSVFNTTLLARLRRQTAKTSLTSDRTYPANIRSYDQNIEQPVQDDPDMGDPVTANDDPNDSPDPDDIAQPDVNLPPSEMPVEWWTRMARDPDQTPVNPTDAQTVFEFIGRRLASGAPAGTKFDSVTTIGELHESIAQHFGPAGWTALASFWAEAAGLPQSKHLGERCLGPGEPSNAPQSPEVPAEGAIGAPVQPDLLDPAVLSTMPDRVAGWLRYQPRDPPPWVYQESAGEKADREFLQDEGAWTG